MQCFMSKDILSRMNMSGRNAVCSGLITSLRSGWSLNCKALAKILYMTVKWIIGHQWLRSLNSPSLWMRLTSPSWNSPYSIFLNIIWWKSLPSVDHSWKNSTQTSSWPGVFPLAMDLTDAPNSLCVIYCVSVSFIVSVKVMGKLSNTSLHASSLNLCGYTIVCRSHDKFYQGPLLWWRLCPGCHEVQWW